MAVFLDRGGYWWSPTHDLRTRRQSSADEVLFAPVEATAPPEESAASRLNLLQTVWGQGFVGPGAPGAARELLPSLRLTRSSKVLDLSAELGGAARYLCGTHGVSVTALERRHDLVAHAASFGDRSFVQHYDPETADLPRGRFDGAYAQHLTCRLTDKERLLREVYRALKPRGHFGFVDLVLGDEKTVGGLREESPAFRSPASGAPWRLTQYLDCLGGIGFSCGRVIDRSVRFRKDILSAWQGVTERSQAGAYSKAELLTLVGEAGDWLETIRLVQAGFLRVIQFETRVI